MTFETVVVHAVGIGTATIAHVLAKLLHVHTASGNAGFNINLDHGVENHELKKLEGFELFTDEVTDCLWPIEHHLVVAEIEFELASGPHDFVKFRPRTTGHDVGIAILESTNVEIIECFGQSLFSCFHTAPLEKADRSLPARQSACVQGRPIFARMLTCRFKGEVMGELQSREKYNELVALLQQAGDEWVVPGPAMSDDDVAEGFRNLTHILQSALYSHQEFDPQRPVFNRIVSPTRSFTGDNSDAIYFETPVAPGNEYIVRGNIAGAVYTSFTMEAGAADGSYATHTSGVLNDTEMDIDADGNYEIRLGGPAADRNWLEIPADGGRITTRHYFEFPWSSSASQTLHVPISIEAVTKVPAPPRWNDERVSAALQRVINHVRTKTVGSVAPSEDTPIPFVSRIPNELPQPVVPGNMAFAAFDAAYAMAPYLIGDDEALVIRGRWPECVFGNICLWNRWSQMYDYVNRQVSRNRANTTLNADGSFTMVLAHSDPGHPNWIDTEGRNLGTMFFRFFLPEGEIEKPTCEVVKFADLTPDLV